MTVYNFAAGPAVLPKEVLKKVQAELLDFNNSGMSILEISHRSQLFVDVYENAKAHIYKLMNLDDQEYDVLFMQGGGTTQFTAVPLNLAYQYHRAAYIDTGHWSERAVEEARLIKGVEADILASSKDQHYTTLPKVPAISQDTYDYVHITTNNTIMGTAWQELPETNGTPLVGDLSSNFLGQDYPFEKFDLMYAGAQKNLAPAGVTIVILKKSLLGHVKGLPSMLDYTKQATKKSALNTPPVFQIYVAGLVLKWIDEQGGIKAMDARNRKKAQLLYDCLDNSKLFKNNVDPHYRSLMNVPFVTGNAQLDAKFVKEAQEHGLLNLKGHRLVGGMRASIYNAMPYDGVVALCDFIQQFEKENR